MELGPILVLTAIVLVIVALIGAWYWKSHPRQLARTALSQIHGLPAERHHQVALLLNDLARRRNSAALVAVWDEIELPLLQILPDCPPDRKGELVEALEAAALACSNRDTSKRLMTMRNSMAS